MSFVTKRERVFKDDIDLYELPPRNEGKLKAYASCTDARAWSHFYSDQSEHLVDLIKRNNTSCAPKYVPTKVIVDTIMSQKNFEISRLRRKIDTLDQMLAVYDQLELDCGQKCEIARAHESIKAASKDLDEVCLDLDMSGFTEGLDSEVYETGKSRGDEIEKSKGDMSVYSRVTPPQTETKAVQKTPPSNDAATVVKDPRIEEMRDEIIFKDAKLNAMQNSMAVLENDVCEPYCIYAHIYTALEKIYGILYQNDTYRQYLELLSAGKDTRCLDIKGRILFKMKVLEKFALALMAPCSKKFADEAQKENAECDCGRSKIVARVETTYALTASESEPPPTSDSKRAHLVAEIMDNDEMKEILERDPFISDGLDTGNAYCGLTCYSIDAENVKRLKDLQKSYDELMECFENLKHEKDCLQLRCRKYNELEIEVETLREQLASCNALWSEKEHYRKRSADLEDIHEKFLILQNVSENLESELKAEKEIKNNKMQVIEDLRKENLILERKLSDATIAFEKEKSALLCKLKEFECALSCKDQEVKSLSEQFQKHFDENQERERDSIKTFSLLNDIELLKEELNNTKSLLNCCEEEKQHIKDEFQDKLSLINDLRMEIEDWKGNCEELIAQKNFMETQFNDEIAELEEQNINLNKKMDEKTKAISNLMEIISEKSKEINTLFEEIFNTKKENEQMMSDLLDLRNEHSICKENFESEKCEVLELLESERKKNKQLEAALDCENLQEILHDEIMRRKTETRTSEVDSLRGVLEKLSKENQLIHEKLNNRECCQEDFKQQYERLKDDFMKANEIICRLKNEKRECEISKKKLFEELNNWKQKFDDLERNSRKFHELGAEKYDGLSDNYEEAEISPWKQHHASNLKRENVPRSFDKLTSQLHRAEVEGSIWHQQHTANVNEQDQISSLDKIVTDHISSQRDSHYETRFGSQKKNYIIPISGVQSEDKHLRNILSSNQDATKSISESQEHTRLSRFDENALGRVSEDRERVPLLEADERTIRRFSEIKNHIPSLQTRDRGLSNEKNISASLDIEVKIKGNLVEPSAPHRNSVEEKHRKLGIGIEPYCQDRARSSAADEKFSYHDPQYQEQKLQSTDFDQKASLIDTELKELSELLSVKEITSPRFSVIEANDILLNFPKVTRQDVLKMKEKSEQLSNDKNTSRRVSEHQDYMDENALRCESTVQDQTCLQPFDKKATLFDFDPQERVLLLNKDISVNSDHQERKNISESELRMSEQFFQRDLKPPDGEELLTSDQRAMRFNADHQDDKPSLSINARLISDNDKTTSLELGVQIKENFLELDLSASHGESDIQQQSRKHSINYKPTSHDLKPLKQAKSSAAEKMVTYSKYQERDLISSSEKENSRSLPDYISDLEHKNSKYQDDSNDFQPGTQFADYNQDFIRNNKHSIQTQQRDSNDDTYRDKIFFDEKLIRVDSRNNDRCSDYFSKDKHESRPSFGKTEAEESLEKQRRNSHKQYESLRETDQYKCEDERRPREKLDSEGQNDWKQKIDESEKKRQEEISSLQDKAIEFNFWKEKYNALEKKMGNQVKILDEIMNEKKQLEQKLNEKNNELNAEKDLSQSYLEKARKSELMEGELNKKSQSYENVQQENLSLQRQLDETNEKIADLLQSLDQEKLNLHTLSKRIPDLEVRLIEYQKAIDDALVERDCLQKELKGKTEELSEKLAENDALKEKLQELRINQTTSDENLVTLQNQRDELQHLFKGMEQEHNRLLAELEEYKSLLEDLDNIKNDYDRIKNENKDLRDQLKMSEKRNNEHISALVADNKQLESMLLEAREEVVRGLESPERSFYQTVRDQVKTLEKEKYESHAKIRELKDQQDANENLISELKGELLTRDERISILENHINLLQDEIKQLHKNLDDGVSASEQLQGQAFEGYDNSMKKIEAHHSKAFHNMKMELDQLEKEKAVLKEQLSKTKDQNEESLRDNKAYLSKIADLTNERTIMLNELKKLEYSTIGNTGLVTDNDSDIQSVKESFSRIGSNLEANRSQSAALESKLHIVKNSSEELLSKTNEAKKIAENEKQKLKLEKEEAVRERTNLEKKLQDLETIFKKQRDADETTIEDLKKEILNQELLIKEMKESTQEYIQKLNDELETMKNLYNNSTIEIYDLKGKLEDSHRENGDYRDTIKIQNKKLNDTIENYNEILDKQSKEMSVLQEALNDLRSKEDADIQTQTEIKTKDSSTQSLEKVNTISENRKLHPDKKSRPQEKIQGQHRQAPENITMFAENITELQIMNANVQPTLDFVKNTYTKYKQGQLSPGPFEQHSILSLVEPSIKNDLDNQLIDIYNRRSLDIKESQYDKTNNTDQSLNTNSVENIKHNNQNMLSSIQSNDEDVFVIYTSSETVHNEQPPFSIPDSSMSNKISRNEENNLNLTNKTDLEKGFDDGTNKKVIDDVRKPRGGKVSQRDRKSERDVKVKISASDEGFGLPKKHKPNVPLFGSIENAGKSSQSSYNGDVSQQMLLHSSDTDDDKLKRKETQSKSNLSLNETKPESEDFFDNLSNDQDNHFKLSRVEGESIILNDKNNKITPETSEKQDLGLNFILETAKQETQQTYDYNTNSLRRSQSAESFSKNSSQTGQGNSFAAINRQQIVSHSIVMPFKEKKVADKGVSINIATMVNSQKKIEQLTEALDNSEKDYKKKLEAIKAQYDANIKRIINEHNEGVKNLQNLHEDMLTDLVKKHENEVENLRSISFEAIKRAEKMEKENKLLKNKLGFNGNDILDQEPVKIDSRSKVRDARLSKTTVESFDVKPRMRHSGPCTCSLDVNVSDTIRNIFDQVDQDQRKLAEFNYVKYIAHKMLSGNVDALDSQELAFLHYNVCRHWKVKQNIEDTLRKKIDSLETELISKQRHAQQHIAELDRRVAEERRRLQEVREAVGYQPVPGVSHDMQPDRDNSDVGCICTLAPPPRNMDAPCSPIRVKRVRPESHCSERRVSRPLQPQPHHPDEMPTRLRRCQDRASRSARK